MDKYVREIVKRIDALVVQTRMQKRHARVAEACSEMTDYLDYLLFAQWDGEAQESVHVFFLNFLHHCYGKFTPKEELQFLDHIGHENVLIRVKKIRNRFASVDPQFVTAFFAGELFELCGRIHNACDFLLYPEKYEKAREKPLPRLIAHQR